MSSPPVRKKARTKAELYEIIEKELDYYMEEKRKYDEEVEPLRKMLYDLEQEILGYYSKGEEPPPSVMEAYKNAKQRSDVHDLSAKIHSCAAKIDSLFQERIDVAFGRNQPEITEDVYPDLDALKLLMKDPFTFASDKHWKQCFDEYPGFFICDRNIKLESTPPKITLLNEFFGKFMTLYSSELLFEAKDESFTKDLIVAMHQTFDENNRAKMLVLVLCYYFSFDNKKNYSWPTTTEGETDLTICSKNNYFCLNILVKNEPGMGGDPDMQTFAHYIYQQNYSKSFKDFYMPCFLLQVVGNRVSLNGALNVYGGVVNQVLIDPITINLCPDNIDKVIQLFVALKQVVKELVSHYNSDNLVPLETSHQFVPYPLIGKNFKNLKGTTYEVDGNVVKYIKNRYGTKVHQLCFNLGHAPELISEKKLPDDWIEITMEKVEHEPFHPTIEAAHQLENVLDMMARDQEGPFVHGDLRESNLGLRKDNKKLVIFDFDWSGIQGQDCYPEILNRRNIEWHKGQFYKAPLDCTHDQYWLQEIKKKL